LVLVGGVDVASCCLTSDELVLLHAVTAVFVPATACTFAAFRKPKLGSMAREPTALLSGNGSSRNNSLRWRSRRFHQLFQLIHLFLGILVKRLNFIGVMIFTELLK
jgi:hypothetical protein